MTNPEYILLKYNTNTQNCIGIGHIFLQDIDSFQTKTQNAMSIVKYYFYMNPQPNLR